MAHDPLRPANASPTWRETTPRPGEGPLVTEELPIGGSAVDRLLAAAGGLLFAALLIRLVLSF